MGKGRQRRIFAFRAATVGQQTQWGAGSFPRPIEKGEEVTNTRYVGVSIALLAAFLAASFLVALGGARVAFSQEEGENNKPQGGASDGRVGAQQATAEQVITSDGPLTSIAIGNTLVCQVDHEGNGAGGEFWDGGTSTLEENSSCGTWLAVGDTTFGQFTQEFVDFTPVRQSAVKGNGTRRNPFKIETVVDAGNTGLRIFQTDSYVVGKPFYKTKITVKNRGASRQNVILYRLADCFLNLGDDLDRGKVVPTGFGDAPACESTDPNAPEEASLLPRSTGSTYQAGDLDGTFNAPEAQVPYGNTCDACPNEVDTGVGLSWELGIRSGDSKTKSHRTKVVIPSA